MQHNKHPALARKDQIISLFELFLDTESNIKNSETRLKSIEQSSIVIKNQNARLLKEMQSIQNESFIERLKIELKKKPWLMLASHLFIAIVVTVIIGLSSMFNNSIESKIMNNISVLQNQDGIYIKPNNSEKWIKIKDKS